MYVVYPPLTPPIYFFIVSSMSATDSINLFLDDLLKDMHGVQTPADELEEMKKELLPKLNEYITLRVMTELAKKSQDTLKEFQTWVTEKKPSQEEVQKYIEGKLDNPSALLTQVLLDFRNTYMGPQGVS